MLQNNTFNEKEYDEYFDNYIQFIKDNEQFIDTYVNLDVINDPVRSMKNYKRMIKEGLNPIGVVHPGLIQNEKQINIVVLNCGQNVSSVI